MRIGKFNEGREYLEQAFVLTSVSRRSPASKFPSFAPLKQSEVKCVKKENDADLEDREWKAIISECMLLGKELKLERELEMLDLKESTSRNSSVAEIHNLLESFVCAADCAKNGTVLTQEHVLNDVLRAFEELMTFGRDQLDPDNIAEILNHAHTIAAQEGLKRMSRIMNRVAGVCVCVWCMRERRCVCVCVFACIFASAQVHANK